MRITSAGLLALLGVSAASASLFSHHADNDVAKRSRHNELAKRADNQIAKRGAFNGQATFFSVGLGACGKWNSDKDYIVALNVPQYGDTGVLSWFCFKSITIEYNGKQHEATIMDACPGCAHGSLDMSPALFQFFAPSSQGVFQMTWWLNDGSGSGQSSSSSQHYTISYSSASNKASPTSTHWTSSSSTSTSATPTQTGKKICKNKKRGVQKRKIALRAQNAKRAGHGKPRVAAAARDFVEQEAK